MSLSAGLPPQPPTSVSTPSNRQIFGLPVSVFWLGLTSFFTDISSEIIFSVFSLYLTVVLGVSAAVLGFVEGIADFSASALDFISGYFSDKTGKRKCFAMLGYIFSSAAKLLLVFTTSLAGVISFRIVERLGKSIRGVPRDALLASSTDAKNRGYAFGFHKAMDRAGAVIGPFIAYYILDQAGTSLQTFRWIFAVAIVPAWIAVLVLGLCIREASSEKKLDSKSAFEKGFLKAYQLQTNDFRTFLKISLLFSCSYFGFGFLLLKAYAVGFQIKDVVLLYAMFNLSITLLSIPIGQLGDKVGRMWLIAFQYFLYATICLGFTFVTAKFGVVFLFLLYGCFYSIDEGQTKAFIVDISREEGRGRALGIYSFVTGLSYLPASLIAGLLWKIRGSNAAFLFAAVIAFASWTWFVAWAVGRRKKQRLSE